MVLALRRFCLFCWCVCHDFAIQWLSASSMPDPISSYCALDSIFVDYNCVWLNLHYLVRTTCQMLQLAAIVRRHLVGGRCMFHEGWFFLWIPIGQLRALVRIAHLRLECLWIVPALYAFSSKRVFAVRGSYVSATAFRLRDLSRHICCSWVLSVCQLLSVLVGVVKSPDWRVWSQ